MTGEQRERANRIYHLRKLASEVIAWESAGCPVIDEFDAYPSDLWPAFTRPTEILPLLEELERLRALAAEPERKPITIEQLRALPEWWPSSEGNPTLLGLIRAVERFHGIE
jgi:hypothetical protein